MVNTYVQTKAAVTGCHKIDAKWNQLQLDVKPIQMDVKKVKKGRNVT